jgi:hypothetical protein
MTICTYTVAKAPSNQYAGFTPVLSDWAKRLMTLAQAESFAADMCKATGNQFVAFNVRAE